jgi:hypothetical protein
MSGGGDRAAKFEVRMALPGLGVGDAAAAEKLTLTCMGTDLPPMILGVTELPHFGRTVKVAGDRQYPEWRITVINDEDYLVRRVMEKWSHGINTAMKNTTIGPYGSNPATYKTDAWIYKFGKEGQILRTYKMVGAWPVVVSPIALNWGDRDRVTEFQVEFAYDYWENDDDILSSAGSGVSNSLA